MKRIEMRKQPNSHVQEANFAPEIQSTEKKPNSKTSKQN